MSYMDRYPSLDGLIVHLNGVVPAIQDPFLRSQYVGFLCVSVVTVFELCIKDLFIEFADKKHKVFGAYCANLFDRLNGRVSLKDLKEMHIVKFGGKYSKKFASELGKCEAESLLNYRVSVTSSYGNVIVWRNSFAHEGVLPANASYAETCKGYDAGKKILDCLAKSMVR